MDNQKGIDYSNKGKFYDCENKTDMNLTRQGWLNFGDEKTRVYGIMRKNQRGEDILSVCLEIGTLKANPKAEPHKADTDEPRQPDSTGVISHIKNVGSFFISAWKTKSVNDNGQVNHFTSLRISPFDENKLDDEIPF